MNINVSLSKELVDFVENSVRSGDYETSDEVIGEALRVLEAQSLFSRFDTDLLRKAWKESMDEGDYQPINLEEVKAEGRRLKAGI